MLAHYCCSIKRDKAFATNLGDHSIVQAKIFVLLFDDFKG